MNRLSKAIILAATIVAGAGCFDANAMWKRGFQTGARAVRQSGLAGRTWGSIKRFFGSVSGPQKQKPLLQLPEPSSWRKVKIRDSNITPGGKPKYHKRDIEYALSSGENESAVLQDNVGVRNGIFKGKSRLRMGSYGPIVEYLLPPKSLMRTIRNKLPKWKKEFFGTNSQKYLKTRRALDKAGIKYRVRKGPYNFLSPEKPRIRLIESEGPIRGK